MASSGLHSNGYSLVRAVFAAAGLVAGPGRAELGRTLGEELLEPTRVYARDVLDLIRADGGRRARPQPRHRRRAGRQPGPGAAARRFARVDRSTWTPAGDLRGWCGELGRVPVGRPRADAEPRRRHGGRGPRGPGGAVVREAAARGLPAWVLGEVSDLSDGRRRRRGRGRARRQGRRRRRGAGRRHPPAGLSARTVDATARGVGVTGWSAESARATHGHRDRADPSSGEVGRARTRCPVVRRW